MREDIGLRFAVLDGYEITNKQLTKRERQIKALMEKLKQNDRKKEARIRFYEEY